MNLGPLEKTIMKDGIICISGVPLLIDASPMLMIWIRFGINLFIGEIFK